jgi:hypothetical protein
MGVVEALIRAGANLNLQDKVSILYVCCMCKHSAELENCVYGRSSRLYTVPAGSGREMLHFLCHCAVIMLQSEHSTFEFNFCNALFGAIDGPVRADLRLRPGPHRHRAHAAGGGG